MTVKHPTVQKKRRWGIAGMAMVGVTVLGAVIVMRWYGSDHHAGHSEKGIERAGSSAFWIAPAKGLSLSEGKQLYGQFCVSCHGAQMQGQGNWRERMANGRLPAPPHDVTGHTWHHPDWQLLSMVKDGFVPGLTAPEGYESDMPAFAAALTDGQIKTILAYIKTYWPADVLKAQKEISLQ
jgi:mono/diheme cytochrome c family protein